MARGLLISYGGYPYALSSLFPDNGLASLAGVLHESGHDCQILDYNTAEIAGRIVDSDSRGKLEQLYPELANGLDEAQLDELLNINRGLEIRTAEVADDLATELVHRCAREEIDFVGFKLWSGDGFEASVHMAERIRAECPTVKLFAGGPAVHYSGDVVLEEAPVFDAVVDGDGEPAILELARYAEGRRSLTGIPNLVTPPADAAPTPAYADLATLPSPDYSRDVYPSVWDGGKLKLISLDESRGCPIQCAFCINWCIEGTTWRTRKAVRLVEEMSAQRHLLNTRGFRMAGTYSQPRLVREICELVVAQKLDVEFGLFLNAGGVTGELVGLLKRAGCFGVFFGVESGSDAILEHGMNKPLGSERVKRALEATRDAGLFTVGSFIFPAPFETAVTEQQTRRFIQKVFGGHPNTAVNITMPGLIPRTSWWNERQRYGFELGVDERTYRKTVLRYKIRHVIPSALWDPLPYRLGGRDHGEIILRTTALQKWTEDEGMCSNMPDYDAQIGATLGVDPRRFRDDLRQVIFTGHADQMQTLVDRANDGLAC